jgi:hypothetical protein
MVSSSCVYGCIKVLYSVKIRILYSTNFNYYLFYIIPLFGIIILILSLQLTFVEDKPSPEIIFLYYMHYTTT